MRSKAMKTMAVKQTARERTRAREARKPPRRLMTQLDCLASGMPCGTVFMDTEDERAMELALQKQKEMSMDEWYEATAGNE